MRTLSLAVLVASATLGAAVARADSQTPAAENPRVAHSETDRNQDGRVDREEFHQRQVDVYYTTDVNKDGTLTAAEFAKLDTESTFDEMDRNENDRLTMYEFVSYRFGQFDDADTDDDGLLSVEEVEEYLGS